MSMKIFELGLKVAIYTIVGNKTFCKLFTQKTDPTIRFRIFCCYIWWCFAFACFLQRFSSEPKYVMAYLEFLIHLNGKYRITLTSDNQKFCDHLLRSSIYHISMRKGNRDLFKLE